MGLFGGPNVEKLTAKKDVEGLIKALVHSDEAVRKAAAEALGDIKDFRAVVPLVAALRDGASSVGMAATEALGKIGDPRAVEPLAAAPRAIRIHAIQALIPLSRWGGTRATEELVSALSDVDPVVRALAGEALGEIGTSAAEPLVAALGHRDIDVRAAASALVKIGGPAIESLVGALRDSRPRMRRPVIDTLCEIGDPAVEPLLTALGEPSDEASDLRVGAAEALGTIGDRRAVDPLVAALSDRNMLVRAGASEALGRIGDIRGVEPLTAALRDADRYVRATVARALGKIGDPRAVEPLLDTLKDGEEYVREAAAQALEDTGWKPQDDAQRGLWLVSRGEWSAAIELGTPAVEPLVAALKDRVPQGRTAAARALGRIRDAHAVKPLVDALREKEVREAALQALEEIGWKPQNDGHRALQLVIELENAQHERRDEIARALAELGPPAVEPLMDALQTGDKEVRKAAAQALGVIGDPRAIESLMSLAADEKRAIREGASPLATLLERAASQVPEEVLREIGSRRFWEWGVTWEPPEDLDPRCQLTRDWGVVSADSSRVVQLARQELIRRGLEA